MIEAILKAGGDPNILDKENRSPLYELTENQRNDLAENKYQAMKLLLDYGGDKTLPCRNGWSAEKVAEEIGDKNTIEILKRSSKDKKN